MINEKAIKLKKNIAIREMKYSCVFETRSKHNFIQVNKCFDTLNCESIELLKQVCTFSCYYLA